MGDHSLIPDALQAALRDARHVCVLTGAGISAESGVPTFREAQTGLWEQYDPQDLATPDAFVRDPALVWRWYRWRRELVANVSHDLRTPLASLHGYLETLKLKADTLTEQQQKEQ